MQEWGKQHGIIYNNAVIIKFNNNFLAAKLSVEGPLLCKGPPIDHLASNGCPGIVVDFNNYSIIVDNPVSLTSLFHGAPHLSSLQHLF